MSNTEGPSHLLSLKVMRVSRPELAAIWQPFYSSSPSFSAHSSASILSLQGTTPLTGHPKTLRDLTHASELLTLPSAFGAIQLGETFTSCICVNNEGHVDVDAVGLKVEMQTVSSRVLIAEHGGIHNRLGSRRSLENIVSHEIKELGQHVLACTVTYRLPPGARGVPGASEEPTDPSLQTFRKFYKFVVTNPLSVKTKVHTPRSPSALLIPSERDKVFVEIHIQNLTQQALHFEQVSFECIEEWEAKDGNMIAADADEAQETSIFSGSMTLIEPQDTRQYVYILNPKSSRLSPATYAPGSVIPLGRLNISWRSSFGEPGRLLTSMLSRRIPLAVVPLQQHGSALPAYLKRTITGNHQSRPQSRPQSPQLSYSRPSTPPGFRTDSPPPGPRAHPLSSSLIRPQSPVQVATPTPQTATPGLEVTLIVRELPRKEIVVEKPFTVKLALVITESVQIWREQQRMVRIAVQRLQPSRAVPATTMVPSVDVLSPRLPSSGMSTPSLSVGTFNYAVAHQKLLSLSGSSNLESTDTSRNTERFSTQDGPNENVGLPPPTFESADDVKSGARQPSVVYVGSSTVFLPGIVLGTRALKDDQGQVAKASAVQEFEATYVPLQKGFATFGGLRAILVEDRIGDGSDLPDGSEISALKDARGKAAQVLKEWDVIGEIWVAS
ncbi:hypothetical protein AX17_003494 [Amanita inopinata Kibby_2008]|nr:hypothetical protein AX17_003494 [Amanita inopinata Kibby_2008]